MRRVLAIAIAGASLCSESQQVLGQVRTQHQQVQRGGTGAYVVVAATTTTTTAATVGGVAAALSDAAEDVEHDLRERQHPLLFRWKGNTTG